MIQKQKARFFLKHSQSTDQLVTSLFNWHERDNKSFTYIITWNSTTNS